AQDALETAVRQYQDPYLEKDLFALNAIKALSSNDQGDVTLEVELPYPSKGIAGALRQLMTTALEHVDGVENVDVQVHQRIYGAKVDKDIASVPGVKNIIAVASG